MTASNPQTPFMNDTIAYGKATDFIAEALADNPLSRLTIKPNIRVGPSQMWQAGWRVTWEQVKTGQMVDWELSSSGADPLSAIIQFARDLKAALVLPETCDTCGHNLVSYGHYTECM